MWRDIDKMSYTAWTEKVLRDFEARNLWSITANYDEANHYPVIEIDKPLDLTVKAGETVEIHAKITDNDKPNPEAMWKRFGTLWEQNGMTKDMYFERSKNMSPMPVMASWWQWMEPSTCKQHIMLEYVQGGIKFTAPQVNEPQTIHILVEATDQGSPALTSYARIVVTVMP